MKLHLALAVIVLAPAGWSSTVLISPTGLPATLERGTYGQSGATYNGFVTATINGIPNQLILCDDAAHTTNVPSNNLIYDFSTVGGSNPLEYVRFTGSSELLSYHEAAVLVWGLSSYMSSSGSHASPDVITDYQYAIWNLFDPYNALTNSDGTRVNSGQIALQNAALYQVNNNSTYLTTYIYPSVRVYTPDPNGGYTSNQEFLQYMPEPGSVFLAAAGALALAAIAVRRKARERAALLKRLTSLPESSR